MLQEYTFYPLEDNLIKERMTSPVRWAGKYGPNTDQLLQSIRERAAMLWSHRRVLTNRTFVYNSSVHNQLDSEFCRPAEEADRKWV
jgi:hypothetical protein